MAQEILELMKEKIKLKIRTDSRYKELDSLITNKCEEKKEERLQARCEELEVLERMDSKLLTEKNKETTGKKWLARSNIIRDGNGTILTDRFDEVKRRRDFVGELYRDGWS